MDNTHINQSNVDTNITEDTIHIDNADTILTNINIDNQEDDINLVEKLENDNKETETPKDIESIVNSMLQNKITETIKPLLEELKNTKKELLDVKAKKDPTQEQILKLVEEYTKEESEKKEKQRLIEEAQKFYNENKNIIYEAEDFVQNNGFTEDYKQKLNKIAILELIGNIDLQPEQKNLFIKNLQNSSILKHTYKTLSVKQDTFLKNKTDDNKKDVPKRVGFIHN